MVWKKRRSLILLMLLMSIFVSSCGGGDNSGGNTSPQTGSVQGYVYIPYGSAPARDTAETTGYKPYSGANINVTCGGMVKTGTSGGNGYFKISSLPVGNCTVATQISGYITQQSQVTVAANQTVSVGGMDGIKMTPNAYGAIVVGANVVGGIIILDNENTGIVIPSGLSYTLPYVKPGTHTVNITKTGFDAVAAQTITVTVGATANVSFIMNPTGNHAPVANAGPDGKTFIGTYYTSNNSCVGTGYTSHVITYTLDGRGSNDADGNPITYKWEQTSGQSVAIAHATSSIATFIPSQAGTYTFKLTVNDGYLSSSPSYVNISASHVSGKIAYASIGCGSNEIHTVNADGTNDRQLYKGMFTSFICNSEAQMGTSKEKGTPI